MVEQNRTLTDARCPHCGKLIFKADNGAAAIEVKCPSCGRLLTFIGVHFGKPIFLEEEGTPQKSK